VIDRRRIVLAETPGGSKPRFKRNQKTRVPALRFIVSLIAQAVWPFPFGLRLLVTRLMRIRRSREIVWRASSLEEGAVRVLAIAMLAIRVSRFQNAGDDRQRPQSMHFRAELRPFLQRHGDCRRARLRFELLFRTCNVYQREVRERY